VSIEAQLQAQLAAGRQVFFRPDDLPAPLRQQAPAAWLGLLTADSRARLRELLEQIWDTAFHRLFALLWSGNLPEVVQRFAILADEAGAPALLYICRVDSELIVLRGNLPVDPQQIPERWQSVWPVLSDGVRSLYRAHDGFHEADLARTGKGTGYLPIAEWWRVGDSIPGLDPENAEGINVDNVVVIYEDRGVFQLGFEVTPGEPVRVDEVAYVREEGYHTADLLDRYDAWFGEGYFMAVGFDDGPWSPQAEAPAAPPAPKWPGHAEFDGWVSLLVDTHDEIAYRYITDLYSVARSRGRGLYFSYMPGDSFADPSLILDQVAGMRFTLVDESARRRLLTYLEARFGSGPGGIEGYHQRAHDARGEDLG
jgi:hypothetical protein